MVEREVRTISLCLRCAARYPHRNHEPPAANRLQIIPQQVFHWIHPGSTDLVHPIRGFQQRQLGKPLGNVSHVHGLKPEACERWYERQLESQFHGCDEETVELRRT